MSSVVLKFPALDFDLKTAIGEKVDNRIRLRSGGGYGLYGPYVDLAAGRCIGRVRFSGRPEGHATLDFTGDGGKTELGIRSVDLADLDGGVLEVSVVLPRALSACEVRLYCEADVIADIECLEIEMQQTAMRGLSAAPRTPG